jgi:ankyrin repeat protein
LRFLASESSKFLDGGVFNANLGIDDGNALILRAAYGDKLDKNKDLNSDYLETIKFLVKEGANVNAKDKEEEGSLLHIVAQHGTTEATKYLVENGANIDEPNTNGETPLLMTAKHEWDGDGEETAKYLISAGARTDIVTNNNETLLYFAARKNFTDIVDLMLEKHPNFASLATKDQSKTPLAIAIEFGSLGSVRKILEKLKGLDLETSLNHPSIKPAIEVAKNFGDKEILELIEATQKTNKPLPSPGISEKAHRIYRIEELKTI